MSLFLLLLAFIGLAVGLAWYLIAHDRGEKEPIYALWFAAGLGAVGALAAGYLESRLVSDTNLQLSTPSFHLLSAALLIGLTEELCKFVPLAFWLWHKRYFNEHTDGVIYFALAGLGFGLPENILYTMQYGKATAMARLFLTPVFHAATIGLVGYFLARQKLARKSPWPVVVPLLGAVLLHGLYDFGTLSNAAFYQSIAVLVTFCLSIGLFILYTRAKELDQDSGLSQVGHNAFCRSCGWANPSHHLYCVHCGKNA
jgi:RsiW-degrading membrane proteinase PrsW (M82 family)